MKKIIYWFCLVSFFAAPAAAETSLWKLEHGKRQLYIGGTCHMLRKSDYPLPKQFDQAYQLADKLIFETDIGQLSTPQTQQLLLSKVTYRDGLSLDKVLLPQTYAVLQQYAANAGIPMATFNQFKPVMVVITLTALELMKLGVSETGVDMHYFQRANADNKAVAGLESVEEHLNILANMGQGNEDAFIDNTIKGMSEAQQIINAIIDSWKTGNEGEMLKLLVEEMQTEYPKLYKDLLVDRNNKWLPKIEAYINTPETELVLVGVAHLVGEDGVIDALKRKGYKVKKVK